MWEMDSQNNIPERYKIEPWSRLPIDILKWTQEEVFVDGRTQNYGGNYTFYEDEVNSIVDWLIPNISGKVFFDVGAKIGIWSVIATLAEAREIHLFEPSGPEIKQAEKNVKHANMNVPVYIVNREITNAADKLRGITLDSYNGAPDFIKIDTEGAEFRILEGAQETIKQYHPMLMIESHSGPERDQQIISLAGEGYQVAPIKGLGNHRHVFLF